MRSHEETSARGAGLLKRVQAAPCILAVALALGAPALGNIAIAQAQPADAAKPPAPVPTPVPDNRPAPPAPVPDNRPAPPAPRPQAVPDSAIDAPLAGPGGLVCLASTIKDGATKGKPLVVSVVASKADEFRARGFTPTECTGVNRRTVGQRKTYCAAAATGNRSLTMAYWRLFAITPRELCQSVDALQSR